MSIKDYHQREVDKRRTAAIVSLALIWVIFILITVYMIYKCFEPNPPLNLNVQQFPEVMDRNTRIASFK